MHIRKRTYTINIYNENMEEFDPNLVIAINDIFHNKYKDQEGCFDYEVIFLREGFVSDSKFNSCFNVFLHDMIENQDGYFHSIPNDLSGYDECIKEFILDNM